MAIGMAIGNGAGQAKAMALNKTNTSPSLCTNCMYNGDCLYQRHAQRPVVHCELHKTITSNLITIAKAPVEVVLPRANELCTTCDHRTYCVLRSPERIVLHCDHFE
jgi:hypothetical protein